MPKFTLYSKTVIGIIVMAIPALSQSFGWEWSSEDSSVLQENLDSIFISIGALLALYGRKKADRPLSINPKDR